MKKKISAWNQVYYHSNKQLCRGMRSSLEFLTQKENITTSERDKTDDTRQIA